MSEGCNHDCSNCSSKGSCSSEIQKESLNKCSNVKKVIGIVSGKGGVGKSMVTSLLATLSNRKGLKTAILDADITGPSIPKAFGITGRADSTEDNYLKPLSTKSGIDIMSTNLLLKDETQPVIWRGPIIADMVRQFWTDVVWKDIDVMFVDMPPGTGDVPLTVFQLLPVDGIIIVTSPQELVNMIVEKAINMADMMNVPVLGIVENMSYFKCPDCDKEIKIFGDSKIENVAKKHNIKNIAKLPINPNLAKACDNGNIESFNGNWLDDMIDEINK